MKISLPLCLLLLLPGGFATAQTGDLFSKGEAIDLDGAIPANERGIVCLTATEKGQIYGGTTGRAAHLFVYDPVKQQVRSLARLEGGVGFAHGLVRLPDGSLIGGTQADPTGIAKSTDAKAVGHLYRFLPSADGPAKMEDLGVPVAGQGIYTLAYVEKTNEIVGNTWPDGHFFTYDLKAKAFKDHGAIAGYRTFETPKHAEDVNLGTGQKVKYPRQVSRAIIVDPPTGAYTAGAGGVIFRYDPESRKLDKLALKLPAATGREPWTSLDAAVLYPREGKVGKYAVIVGGTSEGLLFELRLLDKDKFHLRSRGKPLTEPNIHGLAAIKHNKPGEEDAHAVVGVGGHVEGMPRSFTFSHGGGTSSVDPGGIPRVGSQASYVGFGAIISDGLGNVYAGERDRIGRLARYRITEDKGKPKPPPRTVRTANADPLDTKEPAKLPCNIVFAPQGTTTDGSGYTALEVGKDGQVYVGAARYGDYGWLLRFDPATKPIFMDKVVSMQQLTGERLKGINTNGKIHAKIVVGADGKVWFASKQAHEEFGQRPEYGDPEGYPGGHLCYFDPKTGFSRSMGILKRQEGLMGGVIDDGRAKLYYRSEPKNHFLVYCLKTGDVQDRGNVGHMGRYMAMDSKGAVYTVGRGQTLCRYDPATGYVEDLAIKIEGDGGFASPYVIATGPNGKLYGVMAGHQSIMEFDIDKIKTGQFPEVVMRNVAPSAPGGMVVDDIHAAVFGKDGKFYYPLNTHVPDGKAGRAKTHLRIMRFDPISKKTETVGVPEIVGLDEEKVKHTYNRGAKYELDHMQGAAVGPDGSLYLLDIYPQLNVACFPKLTAPK